MPNYISGAEPFFFSGNRIGCLLIHGFTSTPNEMRELGTRLAAKGYTVFGSAVAGHATTLADMLPTRWSDWHASVVAAYENLAQQCDEIFPIGLSMGGVLSLHLAAHRPVSGIVALSTPAAIENWRVLPFKLFPFLLDWIPSIKKNPARYDNENPELKTTHLSYDRYPSHAAASLIRDFIPHVMDDLGDVRAPALIIQARNDQTIPPHSMEEIHARLGSRDKEMVWLSKGGHLALEDYSKDEAFTRILHFVEIHASNKSKTPTRILETHPS